MKAESRWVPAESVTLLTPEQFNAAGAEGRRIVGYSAWQIAGSVVRTTKGHLLASAALFEPPAVVVLRSEDSGRTWSRPKSVWENPRPQECSLGSRGMRVLSSGRILMLVQGELANEIAVARPPLWLLYSDDDGETWKQGPEMAGLGPFQGIFVCGLFENEGQTVVVVEGKLRETNANRPAKPFDQTWAVGLLRSRDSGLTWEDAQLIFKPDMKLGYAPSECQILPLSAKKWLAILRLRPCDVVARSLSLDGGKTWSPPQPILTDNANHQLFLLPDGGIMLCGIGMTGLRYLVTYDEGRSWAYEQLLESSGDVVVPGGCSLDERTVFIAHGSAMGPPHSDPGYYRSGLRGRWIRKI